MTRKKGRNGDGECASGHVERSGMGHKEYTESGLPVHSFAFTLRASLMRKLPIEFPSEDQTIQNTGSCAHQTTDPTRRRACCQGRWLAEQVAPKLSDLAVVLTDVAQDHVLSEPYLFQRSVGLLRFGLLIGNEHGREVIFA